MFFASRRVAQGIGLVHSALMIGKLIVRGVIMLYGCAFCTLYAFFMGYSPYILTVALLVVFSFSF